ncbi:DUF805 domain-containing protein [uncultured Desulfovibrio sp.]|uniref:DUF805 domain-containing protein n=1 Tax=uncultured Desulfovibrio sp. TaxID=167968 RepID=UPI0025F5BB4E|nr:DUF805 domain-containing protein [uncultured Desulfovibrio sp.]
MRLLSVWKHCFGSGFLEHEGRADREEFWLFSLLALPLAVLLVWLMLALDQMLPGLWSQPLPAGEEIPRLLLRLLLVVIWLGLLAPAVCVTIRRLHDMDASGRWVIAALVPGLAALCCWLLTSWQIVVDDLPRMVLDICAGGLAVLEALAVVSLGLVFLGDGTHGSNRFGADPLGRAPQHLPPTDVNGVPLHLEDDEEEVIDLDDVASPEWHDVPRVELDKETEEELRAGELAREAAPAVQDVVKVATAGQPAAPAPTEEFARMVAQALQKTAAGVAATAGAQPAPVPGAPVRGDWPPADMSPEEMSLASQSLAELSAQAETPRDEELVDSLLEEMEQAEDARREAACIRPGQTVTQAMRRLEEQGQDNEQATGR